MENEFIFYRYELRDTANYRPIVWTTGDFNVQKLKLKKLVETLLGYKIQMGEHCPSEDARAAMQLFKKFQVTWEEYLWRKPKSKKHCGPPSNLPSIYHKMYNVMLII